MKTSAGQRGGNGSRPSSELILVVDDNRDAAQGLQFALEIEGFRVVTALDGDSAVRFLEHEHAALILADVRMPRMDGYALLRTVKQNAAWRDIPFAFVTAVANETEAAVAKSLGADEYIIKPFEVDDLLALVRKLVNGTKVKAAPAGGTRMRLAEMYGRHSEHHHRPAMAY